MARRLDHEGERLIAVAIVGAIVGAWLIAFVVPEAEGGGLVGSLIAAIVGAGAFVGLARLFSRRVATA